MDISYHEFIEVCPSAMMPDQAVFDTVRPLIDAQLFLISGILTPPVFAMIDVNDINVQHQDSDRLDSLKNAVKKYVCAAAFYTAIPQLDLVLTPNGFGVVSNQNVAPASAERVRELRKQLYRQQSVYLDDVIDFARPFVDWKESTHGQYLFGSLFWKADHMRQFGVAMPTRGDLMERMPEIVDAATNFTKTLSPELYEALISAESSDSVSDLQSILITMWRNATVAWSRHDGSCGRHMEMMLGFIEDNIDGFPEYKGSQTYQANHFKTYQNEKKDSCFFFG